MSGFDCVEFPIRTVTDPLDHESRRIKKLRHNSIQPLRNGPRQAAGSRKVVLRRIMPDLAGV
jgi:hypothetical protein